MRPVAPQIRCGRTWKYGTGRVTPFTVSTTSRYTAGSRRSARGTAKVSATSIPSGRGEAPEASRATTPVMRNPVLRVRTSEGMS